ncbi:MAG: YeiH family protein [Pseudomonadota bacterium]
MVSVVLAIAAQFLSEHYGAPAMLMALLLGMAFNFLAEHEKCSAGIDFSAKAVLRFGVALLGVRISFELLIGLGWEMIALVVLGVVVTLFFGLLGAKLLGRGWRFALLTGGSVAICGVSAAMAIAAVLPKNEHSERNLLFTVLSVTVLSTLAMIIYPIITQYFRLDDISNGVFLGGTIHDVAQVVGAGFSVSEETGETATLVKLIRVSMLAPVVLIFSLILRGFSDSTEKSPERPPLLPGFIAVFLLLAVLNSLGVIPMLVSNWMADLSRWALLIAIAAVGMKTSLQRIFDVGGQAIVLIVAETVFIAAFILIGIRYLS